MTKQTRIILIVLAVVAIAAAVFFLLPKKKKTSTGGTGAGGEVDANGTPTDQFADNATWSQGGGNNSLPTYATPPIVDNGSSWVNQIFSLPTPATATAGAGGIISAGAIAASGIYPIKEGSRGEAVKVIQTAVNQSIDRKVLTGTKLVVDGIWGPKTTAMVKKAYPTGQISYNLYKNISARVATMLGII